MIVTGKVSHDRARMRVHDFQHAFAVPQHALGQAAGDRARQVAKHKAALAGAVRGVERSLKPRQLRVAEGAVEWHVAPVGVAQIVKPVAAGIEVGILGREQRLRLRAVRGRRAADRAVEISVWKTHESVHEFETNRSQ